MFSLVQLFQDKAFFIFGGIEMTNLTIDRKFVFTVAIALLFFISMDLYASSEKTELEVNQEIYHEIETLQEKKLSQIGELLLQPVKTLKEGTEKLFFRKAFVKHDELSVNEANHKNMLFQRTDGPKVSLSF